MRKLKSKKAKWIDKCLDEYVNGEWAIHCIDRIKPRNNCCTDERAFQWIDRIKKDE